MNAIDEGRRDIRRDIIVPFYTAVARRDMPLLRTLVTSDWAYLPPYTDGVVGPDLMLPIFADICAALPDMKFDVLDVLIHDDKVGVRARVTGTQSGALLGIAPTSKSVDFAIHSFHELRAGRIAKTWHLEDWLGIFRQIGSMPTISGDRVRDE
jgi:ketosteroid isomerase-like protein